MQPSFGGGHGPPALRGHDDRVDRHAVLQRLDYGRWHGEQIADLQRVISETVEFINMKDLEILAVLPYGRLALRAPPPIHGLGNPTKVAPTLRGAAGGNLIAKFDGWQPTAKRGRWLASYCQRFLKGQSPKPWTPRRLGPSHFSPCPAVRSAVYAKPDAATGKWGRHY